MYKQFRPEDSPAHTRRLISATCCGLRAGLRPLYLPAFSLTGENSHL